MARRRSKARGSKQKRWPYSVLSLVIVVNVIPGFVLSIQNLSFRREPRGPEVIRVVLPTRPPEGIIPPTTMAYAP